MIPSSYLRNHGVPPGRRLDRQYLLLRLEMAGVLLVERPVKLPQLMVRSPVQHPLRLVVNLGDVLEVDPPAVVEPGGLDGARGVRRLFALCHIKFISLK